MVKKNLCKQRDEFQLSLSANMMKTYCKKLSQTDIRVRLSFPMKCFNEALPEILGAKMSFDFKAIDNLNSQKEWEFRLSTRKSDHPKPVLSKGWLQYVQAKHLKKGDRIILYMWKDRAGVTRFRIRAQRIVQFKLFGSRIKKWTDVENLKADTA